MLRDKKFRVARIWSNNELKKIANLYTGDVVNVSAWKDQDKEGIKYRDYFSNASSYSVTNYNSEARGFQDTPGEIFLNLEDKLPTDLIAKFDTVFNHTTLEHIYEFRMAFKNLCLMSKDTVIIVVPFLQQMHADYGDYWRFTPLALKKLFEENNLSMIYCTFNEEAKSSIYIFAIATKNPDKWTNIQRTFSYQVKKTDLFDEAEPYIGNRSIKNSTTYSILKKLRVIK